MIRTAPRVLWRLLAVPAAVFVVMPVAPAASMAEDPESTVTWAVQPADEHGPDGRCWIELTLDPGQVVTEHLAVRNFGDSAVVFTLQAADGYLTDNGRFNILPSDQESTDGGTWIEIPEQVTVEADATEVVPFTITVPHDATPGDHPAGVAATLTSTEGTVAIESRVGFRVMTQVSGTVTAAAAVEDLTATYRQSWNPFSGGTIQVAYTTTNHGNVASTGIGLVTVDGLFGSAQNEARAEIEESFPGDSVEVETRVAGVWPWGPLRTTVEVTPAVPDGEPGGAAIEPASATVTVWTLPWPQLVFAAVLGAIAFGLRTLIRRRRRRLARLLARARNEGRAEARAATRVGSPPDRLKS